MNVISMARARNMTTQRLRRARRERMVGNRKIRMEGRGMVFAACDTEGKETMGWRGFILGCCCAAIGTLDLGSGIDGPCSIVR